MRLPLPGDSRPIVLGQVVAGMKPTDPPVKGKKNDPMMPIAWTKTYQLPDGKPGRAFTSTMCCSQDLESEGLRRLLVNGCYWALGMRRARSSRSRRTLPARVPAAAVQVRRVQKGVRPEDQGRRAPLRHRRLHVADRGSMPTSTARLTMLWPMFISSTSAMAATAWTLW
ncbi:MAG: hypothetical protein U0797_18150 [Gemmataceae bacterium]